MSLDAHLLPLTCPGQAGHIKVMHDQELAWNKGDINGFMQGYWKSDSLLFVGKTAPAYGWQTTLQHYKQKYPDKAAMGQLTFTILQVKVLDATNAFLMGGWRLKRAKDAPGGYYTPMVQENKRGVEDCLRPYIVKK